MGATDPDALEADHPRFFQHGLEFTVAQADGDECDRKD